MRTALQRLKVHRLLLLLLWLNAGAAGQMLTPARKTRIPCADTIPKAGACIYAALLHAAVAVTDT
jgi:hypothetical protein